MAVTSTEKVTNIYKIHAVSYNFKVTTDNGQEYVSNHALIIEAKKLI